MKALITTLLLTLSATAQAYVPTQEVLGNDATEILGTAFCSLRVRMTLDENMVAQLENYIEGSCRRSVKPNPRSYNLQVTDASCGAVQYEGERVHATGRTSHITIIDNRNYSCRNEVPAKFVVQEEENGSEVVYYSLSRERIELAVDPVSVGEVLRY